MYQVPPKISKHSKAKYSSYTDKQEPVKLMSLLQQNGTINRYSFQGAHLLLSVYFALQYTRFCHTAIYSGTSSIFLWHSSYSWKYNRFLSLSGLGCTGLFQSRANVDFLQARSFNRSFIKGVLWHPEAKST